MQKIIFLIIEKMKKYLKCPALLSNTQSWYKLELIMKRWGVA